MSLKDSDSSPDVFAPEEEGIGDLFGGSGNSYLPCFPTPPYESSEDWLMDTSFSTTSPQSSISEVGDDFPDCLSPQELMSEFDSVKFSDILNVDISNSTPALENCESESSSHINLDDETTIDKFVSELNNIDIPVNFTDTPRLDSAKETDVKFDHVKGNVQCFNNDNISDKKSPEIQQDSALLGSDSDSELLGSDSDSESSNSDANIKSRLRGKTMPSFKPNTIGVSVVHAKPALTRVQVSEPAVKMLKVSHFEQFRQEKNSTERPARRNAPMKKNTPPTLEDVPPCRKAAVQAKINREKKKAYIQDLENERDELKHENAVLKGNSSHLEKECKSLRQEVAYLKNVLANQSTLAGLLKNIGNTNGVSLRSSFVSNKRKVDNNNDQEDCYDHDYGKKTKSGSIGSTMSGGICLHVDSDNVSLEFCSKCAKKAKETMHQK